MASWSSLAGRINVIPLLLFVAGTIACLLIPAIRRNRSYRMLLIWTAIVLFFLTELEGLKTPFYLIYVTPLFTVLLVTAADWFWAAAPRWRIPLAGLLAAFCLLQVSRTLIADSRHPRQAAYDPAVRYMRAQFNRQTFIMGGAQFLFDVGPDWNILDDVRLGYDTGKPAVVVIDAGWADRMQSLTPPIRDFVTRVLATEFHEAHNREGYPSRCAPEWCF